MTKKKKFIEGQPVMYLGKACIVKSCYKHKMLGWVYTLEEIIAKGGLFPVHSEVVENLIRR